MQYLVTHPHETIFCPSNSYEGSNFIIIIWSGYQVEDYTNHNFLKFYKDADHALIVNKIRSVSGIIHTTLGVVVFWKFQIHPAVSSDSTSR